MISACLTKCHVPQCDGGVRKNPIEQVEKKRSDFYNNGDYAGGPLLITSRNQFARREQIATLKKSGVEFTTSSFCKVRALIVGQNPFSQSKNLPGAGETQLIPTGEIDQKIAASVTTEPLDLNQLLRNVKPRQSFSD